ncbi:MAG: AEC family transporter [Solobacterium sp.]|nr:AEC family transporter [Solobacterium sp.]
MPFGRNEVCMALLLFEQIMSLFLILLLGFIIVKTGHLKSTDSKVLTVLSIYVILPVVIIKSFQIDLTPDIRDGFLLATAAAIAIMFVLLGLTELCAKIWPMNVVEKGSLIYSNCANLIIPLVIAVLGEEWVVFSSAFLCVQLVFTWTHGKSMIGGDTGFAWKKILTNINMIAIFVGLVMMLCRIRLPHLVITTMDSVSALLGPLAMLTIGMLLGGMDLKAVFTNKRIYVITLLRLVVFPLILLVLLKVFPLETLVKDGKTILYISFLAAITPSAAAVTQLSQLYDKDAEYSSAINVVTTVFCVLTMPLLTELYMHF